MKAVTVKELKTELGERSHKELMELCLRLSKFKKENKELLTYLLFESDNEQSYINGIKLEVNEEFSLINSKTFYFIKKSVRKILRRLKAYIRYSKKVETEIELKMYFCEKLKALTPSISKSIVLTNLYNRELATAQKKVLTLHEDLQFDYEKTLESLQL